MNALAAQLYDELIGIFFTEGKPVYRDMFSTENTAVQVLITTADFIGIVWQFREVGKQEWQRLGLDNNRRDQVVDKIAELLAL